VRKLQALVPPAIAPLHNLRFVAPEPEEAVEKLERLLKTCQFKPGMVTVNVVFKERCDVLRTSTRIKIKAALVELGYGYVEKVPCSDCGTLAISHSWTQKYCDPCSKKNLLEARNRAHKKHRRKVVAEREANRVSNKCPVCKTRFKMRKEHLRYCSADCRAVAKKGLRIRPYPVIIYQCTECPTLIWVSGRVCRVVCGAKCRKLRKKRRDGGRPLPPKWIWKPIRFVSLYIYEELLMQIGDPELNFEIFSSLRRRTARATENSDHRAWERRKRWLRYSGLIKSEQVTDGQDGGLEVTMVLDRKRLQRFVDTYVTGNVRPSPRSSWDGTVEERKKPWLRNRTS